MPATQGRSRGFVVFEPPIKEALMAEDISENSCSVDREIKRAAQKYKIWFLLEQRSYPAHYVCHLFLHTSTASETEQGE